MTKVSGQKSQVGRSMALSIFVALLLAFSFPGQAQQPAKIPLIGYLTQASLSGVSARTDALRQGLRELGYIEGQNIVIEWRAADGNRERVQGLAAELVRLKVEVIVTVGEGARRPAKEATSTIPIVMAQDADPVF